MQEGWHPLAGFLSIICLAGTFATVLLPLAAVADEPTPSADKDTTTAAAVRRPAADPVILLVRDAGVRTELKLSAEQRQALDDLLHKHNRLLLAIRDVSPSGANDTVSAELKQLREGLSRVLNDKQRARLTNLVLQVQGYPALLRKDVSTKLRLTDQQVSDLTATIDDGSAKLQELRKAKTGSTANDLKQSVATLQREQQQRVLAILNKQQTTQYATAVGAPFDLSKVKTTPADAPEFEGIEAWMNSEPITMESLRGRVVVVNFLAFGCINCIHNYPWYKDWHKRLTDKGVSIIGIHTPETKREQDNNLLAASLKSHELLFPVAVDKERKMWQAWSNGIWPSVYIIDKHGRLRYWWYGELDWQGAGNQKVAERQIEQLLAEE